MKIRYSIILFLVLTLSTERLQAQNQEVIKDISTALRTGSAKELAKFFSDVIELKIDGEKENYSKTQAEVIIRNFFTKYPPANFVKIHNGSSPDGLLYVLGKYTHNQGTHRVYMLIKLSEGNYKIDTLDLTKE